MATKSDTSSLYIYENLSLAYLSFLRWSSSFDLVLSLAMGPTLVPMTSDLPYVIGNINVRTKLAMILYLDRSWSAMIYSVDRSWLGHGVNIYRIIATLINKLFLILHIYYFLTGIDHVLDI